MRATPRLKSVMTPFPHTIDIDTPLSEARDFMRKLEIRHLPVTRDGDLVGILTERDINLLLGPDFGYPNEIKLMARDAYQPDIYVVDLQTRLAPVLEDMAERKISSALVTRKGKLAGLLTVTDVCRAFAEHLQELAPEPSDDAA